MKRLSIFKKKTMQASVLASVLTATVAVAGTFPGGWCTSGVAQVKGTNGSLPWSGNAKDWCTNAKNALGSSYVGTTQKTGAIVVFPGNSVSSIGHVGIVTGYNTMKSMNYLTYGAWSNSSILTYPNSKYHVNPSCYIYYNMSKI